MKTTNIRMQRSVTHPDLFNVIAKDKEQELVHTHEYSFDAARALLMRAKGQKLNSEYWTKYVKPVRGQMSEPVAEARAMQQAAAYAR